MTAPGAALIATAKAKAVPVTSCVAASLRPDHLLSECSWEELAALVIVLAEAADPLRLRDVVAADNGPVPPGDARLRRARAEAQRLRADGLEVPAYLARLEREYWRTVKRQRREREVA